MTKLLKTKGRVARGNYTPLAGGILLCAALIGNTGLAYERYNDGCQDCHGSFTGATSTKGSVFPSDNKHTMHRSSTQMNTDCDLCHTNGDNDDPFIGSSNGTANNPGIGCTGCHDKFGLRAHHKINGETECSTCHTIDGVPPAENIKPPYYGTVDTRANNPFNDVLASKTNENWTVGDFVGTDNDGDDLYDLADFDCGPYEVVNLETIGNNVLISWKTAGGRRDVLQAASSLKSGFSDVGPAITIPGVGVVTTNQLHASGATSSNRFYRIRYAP